MCAVRGLAAVAAQLFAGGPGGCARARQPLLEDVFPALFAAMDDYSVDNRCGPPPPQRLPLPPTCGWCSGSMPCTYEVTRPTLYFKISAGLQCTIPCIMLVFTES